MEWKPVNVTAVPKGGDSELTENFCPVSVLPVVIKVFERLVHQQLFNYLVEEHIVFCTIGFQNRTTRSGFY